MPANPSPHWIEAFQAAGVLLLAILFSGAGSMIVVKMLVVLHGWLYPKEGDK